MKPLLKVVILLAALSALVASAAIIAVIALPGTDFVRNGVQDKLKEVTGQEVSLGSIQISGSFPSLISLTIQDVAVKSLDGKKVLSADSVALIPELAPLLKRELSVKSLTIRGLRTTMRRAVDGSVQNLVFPAPLSSQNVHPSPDQRPETDTTAGKTVEAGSTSGQSVSWSVAEMRLEDCRFDWIDQYVAPGQDTIVAFTHVNGTVKRLDPANAFALNLTGRIANQAEKESSLLAVEGVISLSNDLASLQSAKMNVSSDALNIEPVSAYVPSRIAVVRQIGAVPIRAGFVWEKGKPGRLSVKTESKEPLAAKLSWDAYLASGFSTIERAGATCEVKDIPVAFVKPLLPETLPLNRDKGTMTASVRVEGTGIQDWQVTGSVELNDVAPIGSLAKLAPSLRVIARGTINPQRLSIEHLQVSDRTTLAKVAGEVSHPLSDKRALDLKGEFLVEPQWLKSLGLRLPKEIQFNGPIPVQGSVKGRLTSPSLDVKADLSSLAIEWRPYLEKAKGSRAGASIKGNPFSVAGQKQPDRPTISLKLHSVRLGAPPHALPKAVAQLDSAIVMTSNALDLKDATLTVKRSEDGGDLMTAHASVTQVGADGLRFDGNATIMVNRELAALAGLDSSAGVKVDGTSMMKVRFSGAPSVLNFSCELPVNNLDVTVQESFRKPAGVAGSCKIVGKWAGDALELTDARLTIPGLILHARGPVTDRTGKFGEAVLDVKKLELKEFLKFVPTVSVAGLSGPLEGTIHLKNSGGHITPTGRINLLGVDYRPPNAGLGMEKITGSLEPSGENLVIRELKGKLKGAIEAPLQIKGSLAHVSDASNLSGHITLHGGPGNIKADILRKILKQVQLVGTLLGPLTNQKNADLLEIQSLSGSIDIKTGTATTENFKIRGPGLAIGALGSIRLNKSDLDLTAAMKGATAIGAAIGKIPEVQKLVKRHEGLLKATGLDKELKRFGIGSPENAKEGESRDPAQPAPITVIVKVRGPISGPEISPALESSLDKGVVARLKSLLE
jgi:hypothetical protein